MVNALTAEDWYIFETMRERGRSISEIARRTETSRNTLMNYPAKE